MANTDIASLLLANAVPLVVAITAAAGTIVSVVTYKFQRKLFRLASLAEAFRLLNDVKHREARKVIYGNANMSSYEIIGLDRPTAGEGANVEELSSICRDIVRSDFNEIGTLIYYNLLDGKIFIKEYYWVILKIWQLLKDDIESRRKTIGPPNYMEHVEEMKKAAKYAERHYPEVHKNLA